MANIVLYGREGCFQCKMLKQFLERNSIKHDYVDIDKDSEANEKVKNYGFTSLPIVEVSQEILDLEFETQKENPIIKKVDNLYVFSGNRVNLFNPLRIPR